MRKQIFFRLCLVILILAMLPLPAVNADTPVETEYDCSMTLHYTRDGVAFPDLAIGIYRIANVATNGHFNLIAPYSGYPVNIHGVTSQTEWRAVTQTLCSYIAADQLAADRTERTNADGTAVFRHLETGMYLISGVRAENEDAIYQFEPFLIYLPTPQPDGTHNYNVEARPKCSAFTPKEEYKVVKLWKDSGYTKQRPKSVTIEIYKDGALHTTVELSKENDWSYFWKTADTDSVWTVVETDLPDDYKVSITTKDNTITVTNTRSGKPEEPPKTGDTFPFLTYVTAMCVSGSLLLVLTFLRRRKCG